MSLLARSPKVTARLRKTREHRLRPLALDGTVIGL